MNLDKLIRNNIKTMQPYSSARDEFKDFEQKMIFLDANESPFENGVNRYPDPQQKSVKRLLADQKGVHANQILLGNGSDEVLDLLFRVFCEPNRDNVITLPPTYGMYGVLANLNAVENREVLLSADDFQPQTEVILKTIDTNTKMIFLCSPNNPTGNSFSKESIVTLIQYFNGLVVLDEAYIDFSENESWLAKLKEYPNLVITQTFSKAYGLAGIRMGILYASAEIISVLNKIKPPYNLNNLSQQKALEVLTENKTTDDRITLIKAEKKVLLKQLLEVKFIQKTYPSEANYILIKVDDAHKRYNQLLEKGIVVRNRSNQPLCKNCLRISIGTPEENQLLINALKTL
ncbi:histidinol-phosphate aminotransferase [Flavobacterium cauense R2A-7]|uniref:Histidinol-phosphate aminotransferase n=1 Tax=Flavobacterium cauense R2A-7 TaxID=1341154 RepID=A0A562M1A2_9FLAO|nr:histidinol-phosphate transaminase [Flavobacterium cauense]KGO81706.1 histidinol phosphate aminotransferase [Flavobacterium cauense R2A-7]TWI13734.1 histidinol-phosphate aminotransferase [Flavobacterium cauense R2A-7]